MTDLAVLIDELLPQTQCERCGYKGCAPYAKAIATQNEKINLCIPGGDITVKAIATLMQQIPIPVINQVPTNYKTIAVINEDQCIGCTICLKVCPVDAIVGAKKLMHTILNAECTGCELCIEPCPMQCISMVELPEQLPTWSIDNFAVQQRAIKARTRFNTKNTRTNTSNHATPQAISQKKKDLTLSQDDKIIQEQLQAALLRAQQKKIAKQHLFKTNQHNDQP